MLHQGSLRLAAAAAFLASSCLASSELPRPFKQRLRFMAAESGSAAIVAAVPRLIDAGYFDRVVGEWSEHRKASAATGCSAKWCRGLDVFLTRWVDPDETTMWTVDVYKTFGPVDVKIPGAGTRSAYLVEVARWRGDEQKPQRLAIEVEGDRPLAVHESFEPVAALPPELAENDSMAFQKRMLAARGDFPPELGEAIQAVSGFYAHQPMGFLFAVGAAWDRFQQGTPDDPATRVREALPTSVYWWMDDYVRPMRDERVQVLTLEGPMPIVVKGETKEGFVTSVLISGAADSAEERRFAVFTKEGLIGSLAAEFETASR